MPLLPTMVLLRIWTLAPPSTPATPPGWVAMLPLKVLLVMVRVVPAGALMAPLPLVLPRKVLPTTVTTLPPPAVYTPPPKPLLTFARSVLSPRNSEVPVSLNTPPPYWALLPNTATSINVRLPWLTRPPPAVPPFPAPTPPVRPRARTLAVMPGSTHSTLPVPVASTARTVEPGPRIVTGAARCGSAVDRVITPLTLGWKSIVSGPAVPLAARIASRSEQWPG
jgi:hypothetical protein